PTLSPEGRGRSEVPSQLLSNKQQLPMQLTPLAHPHEAQEMARTPVAQLRLRQLLMRLVISPPKIQHAREIRLRIAELRMRLVRLLTRIRRPLARVLDAQERHQHQQFA